MLSQVSSYADAPPLDQRDIQYAIGVSQLRTGDAMELILILGFNSTVEVVRELRYEHIS
jgi:hypothetical protein